MPDTYSEKMIQQTNLWFLCLARTKKSQRTLVHVLIYKGADIFRIPEKGSQMIQRSKISRHLKPFPTALFLE